MNFRTALIVAQVLGIWAAALWAGIEIESILASGPILSLSGCWIAWLAYRRLAVTAFYFGLLAPTFAWLCFLLIYIQDWGPRDASGPVSRLLMLLSFCVIPFGCFAALNIKRQPVWRDRGRVQFGISTMLWGTGAVAAVLGMLRALSLPSNLLALTIAYATIVGLVAFRLHRGRIDHRSRPPRWLELSSEHRQPN